MFLSYIIRDGGPELFSFHVLDNGLADFIDLRAQYKHYISRANFQFSHSHPPAARLQANLYTFDGLYSMQFFSSCLSSYPSAAYHSNLLHSSPRNAFESAGHENCSEGIV